MWCEFMTTAARNTQCSAMSHFGTGARSSGAVAEGAFVEARAALAQAHELAAKDEAQRGHVDEDRHGRLPAEVADHVGVVEAPGFATRPHGCCAVAQRPADGDVDEQHTERGVHEAVGQSAVVVALLEDQRGHRHRRRLGDEAAGSPSTSATAKKDSVSGSGMTRAAVAIVLVARRITGRVAAMAMMAKTKAGSVKLSV